jgi:tRNA ligase
VLYLYFTFLGFFSLFSYNRNNHLKQHRQSLRDVASKFPQSVRLLALNWSLDQPPATIHRICGDRVQERGDNHQTLRAGKSHEEVIWMFISSTQELTPNEVDNVVEMELGESMEDSVKRAVEGCVAVMGLEMPSDEKIQEGLEVVRGYAPAVKKPDDPKDKKKLEVRYYGLLAEVDLEDLLDRALANEPQTNKDFWMQLKTDRRVTKRPHVTIVHRNSIDTERELWDRCTALSTTTPPLFKGTLSNLVWNDRVMAITLEDFGVDMNESSESQEGGEFVSKLPDELRARLHITVGTRNGKIQAVEAKTMVQQWRRGEELDTIKSVKLDNRMVYGRIKGLST